MTTSPAPHVPPDATGALHLKPGKVQPLWFGHPWVFAQAVKRVEGRPAAGDAVRIVDPEGNLLGTGLYSPESALVARMISRDEAPTDEAWLHDRLRDALITRRDLLGLPNADTNAYRLVHSEGDGLGGLIVDVLGGVASVQCLTVGFQRRKAWVVNALKALLEVESIVESVDPSSQKREGVDVERQHLWGAPVSSLSFRENGLDFSLPETIAQKTGYYCDQRDNRALVGRLVSGMAKTGSVRVLDAYSFVGGFALAAAKAGASDVLRLDSSAAAVDAGAAIAARHGFSQVRSERADARRVLREMGERGERFDVVIADPPKLVPSAKHLQAGKRAYQKTNEAALALVAPGGLLVTCSCSAGMRLDEFQRTVAKAAAHAGRRVQMLHIAHQAPDHPMIPAFPEGHYLKCLVLRVA